MRSLAFSLLLICGCALLAEAALRVLGVSQLEPGLYELHATRGWTLRRNASVLQEDEGRALVETNSYGFRGPNWSVEKDPNVVRIAILGDSFIEAKQVAFEDTFGAQLERVLGKCLARPVEVLNFGVQGYGTTQQLLVLREEVWRFQPDVVLLGFFAANDLYDNIRSLNPSNPELAPYFTLSQGKLELRPAGVDAPVLFRARRILVRLANRFRVAKLAWRYVNGFFSSESAQQTAAWSKRLGKEYREWLAAVPPTTPEMKEAWEVTAAVLQELQREVRSQDRDFFLLGLTSAIQVHRDSVLQQRYLRQFRVGSLSYADNRLKEIADRFSIPLIQLAEPMEAYAKSNGVLLHGFENMQLGFGHWNETGHSIAAQIVGEKLCDKHKEKVLFK